MPSKEQMHRNDKGNSKQRPPKSDAEDFNMLAPQQISPATLIQRVKLDPRSLSSDDVVQFQHTIGNQAVRRLLAGARNLQETANKTPQVNQEFTTTGPQKAVVTQLKESTDLEKSGSGHPTPHPEIQYHSVYLASEGNQRSVQRAISHKGKTLTQMQLTQILQALGVDDIDRAYVQELFGDAHDFELNYLVAGLLEQEDVPPDLKRIMEETFNEIFTGHKSPLVIPVDIQEKQLDAVDGQGFTYGIEWVIPEQASEKSGYVIQHVLQTDHHGVHSYYEAWQVTDGTVTEEGKYDQFVVVGDLPLPNERGMVSAKAKFMETNEPANWNRNIPMAHGALASTEPPVGWDLGDGLRRNVSWRMGQEGRFMLVIDGVIRHNSLSTKENKYQLIVDKKNEMTAGKAEGDQLDQTQLGELRSLMQNLERDPQELDLILGSEEWHNTIGDLKGIFVLLLQDYS